MEVFVETAIGPAALRVGQFKEPFSLEWQTPDRTQYFAERSMGNYLGPKRGVGLMLYTNPLQDLFTLASGLFNGDGRDGASSGPKTDSPEGAVRITCAPFKQSKSCTSA